MLVHRIEDRTLEQLVELVQSANALSSHLQTAVVLLVSSCTVARAMSHGRSRAICWVRVSCLVRYVALGCGQLATCIPTSRWPCLFHLFSLVRSHFWFDCRTLQMEVGQCVHRRHGQHQPCPHRPRRPCAACSTTMLNVGAIVSGYEPLALSLLTAVKAVLPETPGPFKVFF